MLSGEYSGPDLLSWVMFKVSLHVANIYDMIYMESLCLSKNLGKDAFATGNNLNMLNHHLIIKYQNKYLDKQADIFLERTINKPFIN